MYAASSLLLSLLVASSWWTSPVLSFGIGSLTQRLNSKQPDVTNQPTTTTTSTEGGTTAGGGGGGGGTTFQYGPKVTLIHNTQEYLDFISHDDRLCVVK